MLPGYLGDFGYSLHSPGCALNIDGETCLPTGREAFARMVEAVGCDNVHLRCNATDLDFVSA